MRILIVDDDKLFARLLAHILSHDPAARVVFLSGIASEMDLSPAYSGAIAVLSKPITVQQLKELFERLGETTSKKFQIVLKSESTGVP